MKSKVHAKRMNSTAYRRGYMSRDVGFDANPYPKPVNEIAVAEEISKQPKPWNHDTVLRLAYARMQVEATPWSMWIKGFEAKENRVT